MLTGCCDTMPVVQAYLFLYFLCQPIQQSGYHLIHPHLFQLCFKLITGSYKFMLIILTFFHICKSLSLIFPYTKCKQDTFRVISRLFLTSIIPCLLSGSWLCEYIMPCRLSLIWSSLEDLVEFSNIPYLLNML